MCAWILAESVFFDPMDQSLATLDGSKKIPLSIREVLLLSALLQKESDKRRLIDIVWPNTIVSDSSYHKLLFELRTNMQAIGLHPDVIKTIPRRGCSINVLAVEVPDSTFFFQPPPQLNEAKDDDADEIINLSYKAKIKNRIPLKIFERLHRFSYSNITIFSPHLPPLSYFLKKISQACAITISITFSFFIFYAVLASPFGEMKVYNVDTTLKNKRIYSLNKDSAPWEEKILNKPFSTGFSYKTGDDVVYFLCEGKGVDKCKNHFLVLH